MERTHIAHLVAQALCGSTTDGILVARASLAVAPEGTDAPAVHARAHN